MLSPSTIKFLKDLKKNNNKPWFDKNRKEYEKAKADFSQYIQQVIDQLAKKDPTVQSLVAKDCMFRINRDVRFSNAGYYFHCEPGRSFTGGGLWMPMPPELKKVRQEIDYNFAAFRKIISSKKFKSVYTDLSRDPEYVLARLPKGYEADNPAAAYLKLKSFVAMTSLKDTDLTTKDLVKKTVASFEALQPLIEFINHSLTE